MKWFRSHIKHGSRLALFALAVQFVLSFGHFHGTGAMAAAGLQPGALPGELSNGLTAQTLDARLSAIEALRSPTTPDRDHDQRTGDICDICAVMALAGTAMYAAPPALLLPQAVRFTYQTTDTGPVLLDSGRVGFRSRAPPAS